MFVMNDFLGGLVVKASALRVADGEFDSCFFCGKFSWSSHISELKISVKALIS